MLGLVTRRSQWHSVTSSAIKSMRSSLLILNLRTFGRLTGAFAKMQMEGQTIRPLAAWFHHPVLTFSGFAGFFSELTTFYWLGEQPLNHWHGQALFNVPYQLVWLCPVLTVAILGAAPTKGAIWRLCIASFLASLAFLAITSAATDFGIRPTPRAWWTFPGFVGGRLMIGTLNSVLSARLGRAWSYQGSSVANRRILVRAAGPERNQCLDAGGLLYRPIRESLFRDVEHGRREGHGRRATTRNDWTDPRESPRKRGSPMRFFR
jgi:hypothetical protein